MRGTHPNQETLDSSLPWMSRAVSGFAQGAPSQSSWKKSSVPDAAGVDACGAAAFFSSSGCASPLMALNSVAKVEIPSAPAVPAPMCNKPLLVTVIIFVRPPVGFPKRIFALKWARAS
jgi:hypothetical protein